MILTDKQIKWYIEGKKMLITEGYLEQNVGAITYDVRIDEIVTKVEGEKVKYEQSFTLSPLNFVYIKTIETLSLPRWITARVIERNSIMRKGLCVSGPQYQPGHTTKMYLKVRNESDRDIKIKHGDSIAQIEFEKLELAIDKTYDERYDNKYENETSYIPNGSMGIRPDVWETLKEINKLEKSELQIYANLITFMGIFVAIFALIVLNIGALEKRSVYEIIIMNLILCSVLMVLACLVMVITNQVAKNIKYWRILLIFAFLIFLGAIIIA